MRNIVEILKRIFGIFISEHEIYSKVGTITSINSGKRTAEVELVEGGTVFDVKLQAVGSKTVGYYAKPTVGSFVVVTFLSKETAHITMTADLDLLELNGSSYGGLIKIEDQTTKLNKLVTEINAQLALIQTAITGLGGVYTKVDVSSFNKSDYENTIVKHG